MKYYRIITHKAIYHRVLGLSVTSNLIAIAYGNIVFSDEGIFLRADHEEMIPPRAVTFMQEMI